MLISTVRAILKLITFHSADKDWEDIPRLEMWQFAHFKIRACDSLNGGQ